MSRKILCVLQFLPHTSHFHHCVVYHFTVGPPRTSFNCKPQRTVRGRVTHTPTLFCSLFLTFNPSIRGRHFHPSFAHLIQNTPLLKLSTPFNSQLSLSPCIPTVSHTIQHLSPTAYTNYHTSSQSHCQSDLLTLSQSLIHHRLTLTPLSNLTHVTGHGPMMWHEICNEG